MYQPCFWKLLLGCIIQRLGSKEEIPLAWISGSHTFWSLGPFFTVLKITGDPSCTDVRVGPQRIDAFELWYWRRLESPLDCKEIKPLILKEIILKIHWKDGEAPVHWSPDVKIWFIGKNPDAGKDWRQKEKWEAEDEMVSTTDSMDMNLSKLQESEGQGSLTCWSLWDLKELSAT